MSLIRNVALERIRGGGTALGFGLYHLRTAAGPGIAKATGYHWVVIDSEHGAFSISEVAELCTASLYIGVSPIVRVTADALDEATRALDNGAQGVIVAMLESVEQAKRVVHELRFPPLGGRGWGGAGVRHGFTPPPPVDAMRELNTETLVVAMIETREGVEQADAIAVVPGIDVLFVGLADLSVSLGLPGQFDAPSVHEAFLKVADACKKHGRVLGMGGVYDDVIALRYMAMGARLVAGGSDHGFLVSGATARAGLLAKIADTQI